MHLTSPSSFRQKHHISSLFIIIVLVSAALLSFATATSSASAPDEGAPTIIIHKSLEQCVFEQANETAHLLTAPLELQLLSGDADASSAAKKEIIGDGSLVSFVGCYSASRLGVAYAQQQTVPTRILPNAGERAACITECFNLETKRRKQQNTSSAMGDENVLVQFAWINKACLCPPVASYKLHNDTTTTTARRSPPLLLQHPLHDAQRCIGSFIPEGNKSGNSNKVAALPLYQFWHSCSLATSTSCAPTKGALFPGAGTKIGAGTVVTATSGDTANGDDKSKLCVYYKGCCRTRYFATGGAGADKQSKTAIPSYYSRLIQWVAMIVIVLAVAESLVYGVVRYRHRGGVGIAGWGFGDGVAGGRRSLRTKQQASTLSESLMTQFPEESSPASASASGSPSSTSPSPSSDLAMASAERRLVDENAEAAAAIVVNPLRPVGETATATATAPDQLLLLPADSNNNGNRERRDDHATSPVAGQDEQDRGNCAICLEELNAQRSVRLPCAHVMHHACFKDYLAHQLVHKDGNEVHCPMCRSPVMTRRTAKQAARETQLL